MSGSAASHMSFEQHAHSNVTSFYQSSSYSIACMSRSFFFVCNEISVLGTLYFKQIAAVYRPHSTQHAEAVAAFGQHVGLQQACTMLAKLR